MARLQTGGISIETTERIAEIIGISEPSGSRPRVAHKRQSDS